MTLNELLTDFYAPIKAISERTATVYGFTISAFAKSLGRPPELSDLEELRIAKFLAQRVREREPATAAKDRAQLRALWEFAARRKLVDTWPTMPSVRVPERVPEAWLADEMSLILTAAAGEPGEIAGIPAPLWWRAIILLCYDSAERIGAVLALKWKHVRHDSVLFVAENRKGRRRDIVRPVSPGTAAAMLAIKGNRGGEDSVFPWDRTYTHIWAKFGRIIKRAGLPCDRRSKFHRIRKTTASYYQAAGESAQSLLDHSSPAVTRLYLDPRIVKGRSAPDAIPKVDPAA